MAEVRITGAVGLLRLSPRKGEHHRQGHRRQGGEEGGFLGLGLLHQQSHPLLDGFLSLGHGGGAGQQVSRPQGAAGHHVHQGTAIGDALLLPQPGHRPLVAGQLSVPLGQDHRQPHQWVIPVEGQSGTPQQGPDVVPVGVVGQFVGQHMAQGLFVLHRLGSQINSRPEQTEQAGGWNTVCSVDAKVYILN